MIIKKSGKLLDWKTIKKEMNNGKFVETVTSIDITKVKPSVLKKIRSEILSHKNWDLKKIKRASKAVENMAIWLNSIHEYQMEIDKLKPL